MYRGSKYCIGVLVEGAAAMMAVRCTLKIRKLHKMNTELKQSSKYETGTL